ncbi:UbiA family prenyltransferase (plasmid) [Sinorhizobium garamanticum]|uniref:UbiA family prenyltransferase n=1 Tax=Sinorhizobium garamanticum TaxID=680247 RepID=A0ABY8DQ52_9HYPH|nr:UbiA family prenyltransferase [Sinorhizobium garamanticum]WEX91690.1 UbiA family prenyltransferase [Sinorhizobium garamanticum]
MKSQQNEMKVLDLDCFDRHLPLICDLDGTLIKSDSLQENLFDAFFRSPQQVLRTVPRWFKGLAALKETLANVRPIEPRALPYREQTLELVRRAKATGRETYLVTAADQSIANDIISYLGGFDGAKGSDGSLNLRGRRKLQWLQERFPEGFIYAGDSAADLPIWAAASGAVLVGNGVKFESQLREAGVEVRTISPEKRHPVKDWLSELRIHQWSKNVLIFVPLFLGRIADFHAVLKTAVGFLAFGLIASATYIINDLADLEADRAHATKRFRAIAAGRVSVMSGFLASLLMLATGIGVALLLHPQFALVVSVYLVLTLAYSFRLKRDALLDVTVIGALFTLRIVMGQVLNGLAFSPWLLSFSAMFFISLALAKRHVEAMRACSKGKDAIKGRGYLPDDWPLTLGYGLASASASIVIMLLFLALEPRVTQLYHDPAWLYVAPLGVFIWLQRIWLLSHRMELHDDPIVFALNDKTSWFIGAIIGLAFVMAM